MVWIIVTLQILTFINFISIILCCASKLSVTSVFYFCVVLDSLCLTDGICDVQIVKRKYSALITSPILLLLKVIGVIFRRLSSFSGCRLIHYISHDVFPARLVPVFGVGIGHLFFIITVFTCILADPAVYNGLEFFLFFPILDLFGLWRALNAFSKLRCGTDVNTVRFHANSRLRRFLVDPIFTLLIIGLFCLLKRSLRLNIIKPK